jgi:hypothetical protein
VVAGYVAGLMSSDCLREFLPIHIAEFIRTTTDPGPLQMLRESLPRGEAKAASSGKNDVAAPTNRNNS